MRFRAALASTLALVPLLAAASVGGVLAQRHELTDAVTLVAEDQARSLAVRVGSADEPRALPDGTLGGEEALAQHVAADGLVLDATGDLSGLAPLLDPPGAGRDVRTAVVRPGIEGESDRVVAVAVALPDGGGYVVAAQSLEGVDAAVASTTQLLAGGSVLVVLVVAGLTWVLTGRALRPVESMRSRAAEITGADLGSRLPDPGTGDEVSRLASTLNDMLDRLQTSAEAQRRFVADASHELRSPVATIRALHETTALSPHPDGPEGLSREVLAETVRLERLVADLLLLARADAGTPPRRSTLDLSAVVTEEAQRSRRHPVTLELPRSDVEVRGDAAALGRLLRNLLDNAERHARSTIHVRLEQGGAGAVVVVSDDGPGVPAADRERVFERFVRLDDARARDDGGSGLGLSIARQVAHEHGGDLRLDEATRGPGARLTLRLPATLDA